MKSLRNQEDIKSTKDAVEQAPSWFLNIPDQKTPWYFISLDYADGFVHWYDSAGSARRVVCAGGVEGKGFATDTCPICAHVLELYQEAKRLNEEGDEARAKQVKDRANRMRAKMEVHFKVIRGQRTLLKTKTGKEWVADFDMSDEDGTSGVGIISLSEAQFKGLIGLINGNGTEFIQSGDDLGNRVLWTSKESRKGKTGGKYSAVVWSADDHTSDMPEVEIPQELLDMDLGDDFKVNPEEVEKVYSLVSGQAIEEPEDDEDVDLDADSDDVVEDSDLDDLDDDEDPDDDDDDFDDDLPEGFDDEDDEEEAPRVKKSPPKAPARKPQVPARKSGRTRL